MIQTREHEFSIEKIPPGNTDAAPEGYAIVVRTDRRKNLALIERAVKALDRKLVVARATKRTERVDRLIEALIEDEPLSAAEEALEMDNAALRAQYLETVPTYTAADLHSLAGSTASNRSALAGGWKKDGKVFAVTYRGVDRFPAFQFIDGKPRPVIRKVLKALPGTMTPWQIAFWFASGNGWLEDATPQERLDDAEHLVAAAEQLGKPTIG